jgi:hypothetical protein
MAGYNAIWIVGRKTHDGVNPISTMVLQGLSDRIWLELPRGYKTSKVKVKTMIPPQPNDPNMLIDMCMAFMPQLFQENPHYVQMLEHMESKTFLDLHLNENVPDTWELVREEVRPIFDQLTIFKADIQKIKDTKIPEEPCAGSSHKKKPRHPLLRVLRNGETAR